jgi:hypothetical protein
MRWSWKSIDAPVPAPENSPDCPFHTRERNGNRTRAEASSARWWQTFSSSVVTRVIMGDDQTNEKLEIYYPRSNSQRLCRRQ